MRLTCAIPRIRQEAKGIKFSQSHVTAAPHAAVHQSPVRPTSHERGLVRNIYTTTHTHTPYTMRTSSHTLGIIKFRTAAAHYTNQLAN